ncbi:Protein PXR1 [Colletotrichum chlorophyti]|uniref:PinX1-related protein 1 n=1 Tax=Colletotrichum chlorophyti TaxID=708187 RepID=A0A1Q8RUZ9_9PEZI|nr:Protein PXR1 [Colletotrichum chlorophyti]
MGLAQAKTRRKIGKDPNNTKWTKDTDSFGQKILRSQGWEPGQYLGAKDAAHAVHHTAANASFIRVALKDDMLGLGFKQARDDRVTGMDVFQDLLGRLNGKSTEAIDKDRQARSALKSTLYCDTKFGPMRFVSGGWLVGDQVKEDPLVETKEETEDDVKMEDVPSPAQDSTRNSKKRKVEESSEDESSSEDEKARKKRRKEEKKATKKPKGTERDEISANERKDKKRKSKSAREETSEDTQDESDKMSKKDKKKKEKKTKKAAEGEDTDSSNDKASKKKRKGETDTDKAARKEEKKRRKEEKRAKKEASGGSSASTPAATSTSTPTASGASTPVLRGHHAVRSRWIAQKRMATMDDKALNQIFMIKSQS